MTSNRGLLLGHYTRATSDGNLVFTAVTEGAKRDGLEIDIAGMNTDNFMRNPVFLWVHDYRGDKLPLGRVVGLTRGVGAMEATVQFDMADPFAAEVKRKYQEGYLNAVSVGWETRRMDRSMIVESDLLDISAVPVPGDADALMKRADAYAQALMFRHETTEEPDVAVEVSEDGVDNPIPDVTIMPPDLPDDSPQGVSAGDPNDGPRAAVEQLDQIIRVLTEWRADLDPTPLAQLASLLQGATDGR